VVVDA
jgi:hypothetical protein